MTTPTGYAAARLRESSRQRRGGPAWRKIKLSPGIHAAALVALAVSVPFMPSFYINYVGHMIAYAIVAMGASIIIQHANLASIGHGAFFGISGYTVGLLLSHDVATAPLVILAAVIAGAIAALLIGVLVVRMSGAYFMITTLAIGQLLAGVATSLTDITGGSNGLTGFFVPAIGPIDLMDPLHYFFVALVALVVVASGIALLIATPFGYALRSLKTDDRRARSLGLSPFRVKLIAFTVSGAVTALGAALYTFNAGYVVPTDLAASSSGLIFMMVVLVNRFGVFAPIYGAFMVQFITLFIGSYTTHYQLVLGICAVLMALFFMQSASGSSQKAGHGQNGDKAVSHA